jgi:hypothetical protein
MYHSTPLLAMEKSIPKARNRMFRGLSREFWIGTGFAVVAIGIEIVLTVIPMPDWLRTVLLIVGGLIILAGLVMMLYFGLLEPSAAVHSAKGRGLVLDIHAEPYSSSALRTRRFRAGGWLAGVVVVLVVLGILMFSHKPEVSKIPPPSTLISLTSACRLRFIPLEIAPHAELSILELHPGNNRDEFTTINNLRTTIVTWPGEQELKRDPLETVYEFQIHNFGGSALLNVGLTFDVIFKGAIHSRSVEEETDQTIMSQTRVVTIGSIEEKGTFTFYLSNRSPFFAHALLLTNATVQLPGESIQRSVAITTEATNVPSDLPLVLTPCRIKETGRLN